MNATALTFVATERFNDGRYGVRENSFYTKPGYIEERSLTGSGDSWVVRRYVIPDDCARQTIVTKIGELSAIERKSARGHRDLSRLLDRWPNVCGYVALDDVDNPQRRVVIAASNIPHGVDNPFRTDDDPGGHRMDYTQFFR